MRHAVVLLVVFVCAAPAAARAQGNSSVQGFGGLTFGTSELGGSSTATSFGGAVTTGLMPNIQIIGEDVKPTLYELVDLTPFDVHVSAWYAQGGVRFIVSPQTVRPYAEATAGLARLHVGVSGFGSGTDALIATALGFVNRTEPMLGLGGGVVLGAGPVAVDVGYRYRRILVGGLASALNAGNAYQVNEARIGIGVRF